MELALLEEHGMTLPPEKQPLRGFDRNGQVNWRRTALSDTRRERKKAGASAMRLTFGLLWRKWWAATMRRVAAPPSSNMNFRMLKFYERCWRIWAGVLPKPFQRREGGNNVCTVWLLPRFPTIETWVRDPCCTGFAHEGMLLKRSLTLVLRRQHGPNRRS